MTQHAAGFEQESFARHATWYAGEEAVIERNYQQRTHGWADTVDGWRHQRMVAICKPLIADGNEWVTVGDGAYGCDAMLLERLGASAIATDISPILLEYAHSKGGLREYKVANVEALPFEDASFDYVLCKESWHHFPRPYMGLYQMLRVARRGVVLIEPTDPLFSMPALMWLTNVLDRIHPHLVQTIWKNRYSFETVGNYVYKLSVREMEKVAMGLALPAVAHLGINDYYHPQLAGHHPAPATRNCYFQTATLRSNGR
jgi:ubiquinone/menaquinone biosynthesis C-methylase UbiE